MNAVYPSVFLDCCIIRISLQVYSKQGEVEGIAAKEENVQPNCRSKIGAGRGRVRSSLKTVCAELADSDTAWQSQRYRQSKMYRYPQEIHSFVSSDSVDWYAFTVTSRCRYLLAMLLVRDQGSLYHVL